MTRRILVHLNVEATDEDKRDPDEIAQAIMDMLSFHEGDDGNEFVTIQVLHADEYEARP